MTSSARMVKSSLAITVQSCWVRLCYEQQRDNAAEAASTSIVQRCRIVLVPDIHAGAAAEAFFHCSLRGMTHMTAVTSQACGLAA